MILPFRRYADFSGRSARAEYWGFALLNFLVMMVFAALFFAFALSLNLFQYIESGAGPSALFTAGMIVPISIVGVYWLAIIVPTLAVTVRRLHDRDMSGWWYLGFIVLSAIPLVGWIVSIAQIVIFCLPGTPGPNRFGEDPLDPTGADVFA
jgi:uncharacterized membrane protein YhaH (DUF805 family)